MGKVCGGCYLIGGQAMMEEKKLARRRGRETGCEPSCRGCGRRARPFQHKLSDSSGVSCSQSNSDITQSSRGPTGSGAQVRRAACPFRHR